MPPETVRATPELVNFFNSYENNSAALDQLLTKHGGYKVLVKYYIRTGLRASQMICRNYLLNLEERNQYLEFLQREIGVAAALSTGILALVNANATLSQAFLIGRTGVDGAIDAYQEFRFLNVDREAARALVEAAQNKLAEHYFQEVDSASPGSNSAVGGYTFSDALNAVNMIEYQCTRMGIRQLLNRSINNSPTNMGVDQETGQVFFRSAKDTIESGSGTRSIRGERPNAPAPLPLPPIVLPPAPPPIVVAPAPGPGSVVVAPPPGPVVVAPPTGPGPGPVVVTPPTAAPVCGNLPVPDAAAARLIRYVCPGGTIVRARRDDLAKLRPDLARTIMVVLTEGTPAQAALRQDLLNRAVTAGLIP
jgi:hypothetical protein